LESTAGRIRQATPTIEISSGSTTRAQSQRIQNVLEHFSRSLLVIKTKRRTSQKTMNAIKRFVCILLFAQAAIQARAGYVVDAQISSQALGDGTYDYTITLNNRSASTTPIGTFWFAWVPDYYGYDLLTSPPTITQSPANWNGNIINDTYYYPDGFSIEWYGASLMPGNSLTFGFNSPDSPSTLGMTSQYFGVPTMTSFVYSSYAFSDPGAEFTVQTVPEPGALGLACFGLIVLFVMQKGRSMLARRRAFARRSNFTERPRAVSRG
jgi:hypothetical protein